MINKIRNFKKILSITLILTFVIGVIGFKTPILSAFAATHTIYVREMYDDYVKEDYFINYEEDSVLDNQVLFTSKFTTGYNDFITYTLKTGEEIKVPGNGITLDATNLSSIVFHHDSYDQYEDITVQYIDYDSGKIINESTIGHIQVGETYYYNVDKVLDGYGNNYYSYQYSNFNQYANYFDADYYANHYVYNGNYYRYDKYINDYNNVYYKYYPTFEDYFIAHSNDYYLDTYNDFFVNNPWSVGPNACYANYYGYCNYNDYNYNYNSDRYMFYRSSPEANSSGTISIRVNSNSRNLIKVYYKKGNTDSYYFGTRDIIVQYIDKTTGLVIKNAEISNQAVGSTYNYQVQSIDGYNFATSTPENAGNTVPIKIVKENTNKITIYVVPKGDNPDGTTNAKLGTTNGYQAADMVKSTPLTPALVVPSTKGLPLNTNQDYQFINGYSDGTFKPDQAITRGEASEMLYKTILKADGTNYTKSYSDVKTSDSFYDAVSYLATLGIVSGFEDGTFRPNDSLTRAEFTALASKVKGFPAVNTEINFNDVSSDFWAYSYIKAAVNSNLVSGYEDGTFRPQEVMTRAEATKVVGNMINRLTSSDKVLNANNPFNDVYDSEWSYKYIVTAMR